MNAPPAGEIARMFKLCPAAIKMRDWPEIALPGKGGYGLWLLPSISACLSKVGTSFETMACNGY
jgi:hypothetical protein